jgi:SAM-dependent methyltransferase
MNRYLDKLVFFRRGRLSCPVCNARVKRFNMIGEEYLRQFESSLFPHSIFAFETLNILGYSCPSCGASDRARLYRIYIDRYMTELKKERIDLLDIAPEPILAACLKRIPAVNYRSADIAGCNVDDKVDITAMTLYEDDRFDFILCSHVLEHVSDDLKAMRELHRVLKRGGKAIVMVPVLLTIDDIAEDEKVILPAERMTRFGQDDHVRLYSKNGFVGRLCEAGFAVNQYDIDFFGADIFKKHGIMDRSVLYVVEKK